MLGGRDISGTSASTGHVWVVGQANLSKRSCAKLMSGEISCIGCLNESILLLWLLGRYFIYHTRRCRDFGFRVQRHRKEASAGGYSLDTGGNSSSK